MNNNNPIIGFLAAAILVGAVGFYTENQGFVFAGVIFLVVSIVLGINQFRNKDRS